MSRSLSFIPSIIVTALPNFLVSKRTLMRCCSLLISPQTHISLGKPHVGQISGIVLKAYQIGGEYIKITIEALRTEIGCLFFWLSLLQVATYRFTVLGPSFT